MQHQLRLISGAILFLFVLTHFLNHALGIVSLRVQNDALFITVVYWRTLPGTILLGVALLVHVGLACYGLYKRRTFVLQKWQVAQIALGFLIPILLAFHIMDTRGAYEVFGLEEGYKLQLYRLWVESPVRGILNGVAILVVWIHGCLGWHYFFRLKPWYDKAKPVLFTLAVTVPVLSIAGYISSGLRITRFANNERWVERMINPMKVHPDVAAEFSANGEYWVQGIIITFLLLIVLTYIARRTFEKMTITDAISYRSLDFSTIRDLGLRPKVTLLDQIRAARIPHASVCGGKGRCSTCRVRVDDGLDLTPPPSPDEARVLERISAAPNVRLACQLVPTSSLKITALLTPDASASDGFEMSRSERGDEQDIAVLFADLRGFTKLSNKKLPFDVAFLLNRYFAAMGGAIEEAGGHLDKFIGDGVMALFGIDQNPEEGCRRAVHAVVNMANALDELNRSLGDDLQEPLRMVVGIHTGRAIVGKMGYKANMTLTAIGDVVNSASRLEGVAKDRDVQLVISTLAAARSGLDFSTFDEEEVLLRGTSTPTPVRIVPSAGSIKLL